jgi:CheY-like chemotaxis protein
MNSFDAAALERKYGSRFHLFQDLMRDKVHNILMVSSLYDSFILEEDGRLDERLINEYIDLNLTSLPSITRVPTGREALTRIRDERAFDLIVTSMNIGDMNAVEFAREVRKINPGIPTVLLSHDYRELKQVTRREELSDFLKVFVWQGDFRILLAIVKFVEDRMNVHHDTTLVGVQSIILIEDSVRFYSSYLPIIYTELMRQSQEVLSDSFNLAHKVLRMRARPKILLCETYEEAWSYFETYHQNILGVISDIQFPHNGASDPLAGVDFARRVREAHPDIPILLQSHDARNAQHAKALEVSFLQKGSPVLLQKVRRFMVENFSFGEFVFRLPDETEVARAKGLRDLEECLRTIPDESLLFHSRRNHFSNWLKARTEFWLAHQLRPRKVSDYASTDALREDIIRRLREFRSRQRRGAIVDYDRVTFDPTESFARIGGGSLGGKGRGLGFLNMLIDTYGIRDRFKGVQINVPPAVVIGTDVFDQFIDEGDLRDFAISTDDDEAIIQKFLQTPLPDYIVEGLRSFVDTSRYPLVIRSSSLLEDSQHQPFAGIYGTFMLANNHANPSRRLKETLDAVRRVYASTFSQHAKAYMHATPYRLEEEKMAVIVQRLIGSQRSNRFYPDFAGVARSHNYYACAPMSAADGIASVALGLGTTVVEGGATLRFCPKYPHHVMQFSTIDDALNFSQKDFYALEIGDPHSRNASSEFGLSKFGLETAERDSALSNLGSTYSEENNAVYDGLARDGVRIVSFAPILKQNIFPLAEILQVILEVGRHSMGSAVEIEFAVNLSTPPDDPREFSIVQMRPMVVSKEQEEVSTTGFAKSDTVCESSQVLGNGSMDDIRDVIMVDIDRFSRSETRQVAHEIGLLNHSLAANRVPYLLIGVGRWGSADPWLGIPVNWDQISGAHVIIETGFKEMQVEPSQGTHFFQNLTSLQIGYFTIDGRGVDGFLDWKWLSSQPEHTRSDYVKHIRFAEPLAVRMDGQTGHGVILKPGVPTKLN